MRREAKLRRLGSRYMDRKMVSLEYGCSESWLYDQARARRIPYELRGVRMMVFRREDVERFFEGQYHQAIAGAL